MNWKPTWVLLAAAAAMLAFIALVEHPLRREKELQASRIILPGLNPALVTNIEIHPWGWPMIQAARRGGVSNSWSLIQPISYPAQSQRIDMLLTMLAKLEWVDCLGAKELNDRPNAQEDFGFTKPSFTLVVQGPGPDRRLEIGYLGLFGDRVYAQVVGNNAIYQTASDILHWLPWDKNLWRDPTLLNLTNLVFQTVHVRADGKGEFDLERDPTNHLWFIHELSLVARGDTPKINDLLARLQTVSVSNFVNDDPQADLDSYGLQSTDANPELSLTFLDQTNIVANLRIGRSSTNNPGMAYARRDHPGSIVEISREPLKPWLSPYTNFLDRHFVSLSPSLIESIAVEGTDKFEVQKENGGKWIVKTGQKEFPADPGLMDYWLAIFTNVVAENVKTVVTEFSEYGLSHPVLRYAASFGPGAGSQSEARIEFGTNQAGKVFERRLGEDGVNTISAQDFTWLPRVSWQLRDRQVWSFNSSNLVGITIHQRGGTLKYLRDPDGEWTYAPGFSCQVNINSAAINLCVFQMARLRAVYWDGVGEDTEDRFGFAKTGHDVEFEVKEGATNQTYRIEFGSRSPFLHPYASVMRNGERLVFEFPADFYQSLVEPNLTLITLRPNYR